MNKRIGLIGSNSSVANKIQLDFAFKLGIALVDNHFDIINGGMGGVMEASSKGAQNSEKYDRGSVIGFLPTINRDEGNRFSGIQILSDIGFARNRFIILNSAAIIGIGGGAGTLNEFALAWQLQKPIGAFTEGGGWASELAGRKIDTRFDSKIIPLSNIEDAIQWLNSLF
ncbi:MAG: hypothetical protein HeimC2_11660 [Candidatus Heimdallarchaeota archaeon LC_2]|nr:MAG: hypothetical protein HeimC2_11660 [Candidatus Heimdallarchaeota archaeon LC_2]